MNETKSVTTVKLLADWTTCEGIREKWNIMTKGNYKWNNIEFVLDSNPDYFVVINKPPDHIDPDPSKTIIFRMEPYMEKNIGGMWGKWAVPDKNKYLKVCNHSTDYNNNEWHLSKTYNQLKTEVITKDSNLDGVLSTVLSGKYYMEGHMKRVDFVKFIEKSISVHVFGSNRWDYIKYKGSLPSHIKDNAMLPYKYVFNCENNSIKNYFTEKLIDGILSECLVFYSGCYNLREYIDERAFVYLELSNFEDDYKKIKEAMDNNLWEERIPYIRAAKKKLLDYLGFCPRLERIINKTEDVPYIS
jgi:hypothetical protein